LSDAAALLCQTFPFQDLDYQIYTPCFRLTFPFYHFSSLTREQRWTHTQRSMTTALQQSLQGRCFKTAE
jgi:hypothetical protein